MKSSIFSSKPSAWFKTKVFSLFSLILFSFLLIGCGGADYDDPNQNPDPRTLKQLNEFTFGSYDTKPAYIDGINFDVDIAVRYDITSYNDNFTNEAPNVTHNGKDYSPHGAVDFRTSTPKIYTIIAQNNSTQNYDVIVRRAFVVSTASELETAISTVTSDIAAGKPISYITIFIANDIDLVATDNITIPYAWAGKNIRLENNNTGSSYVTVKNLTIQGGSTVERIRVTVIAPVLICTAPSICNPTDFNKSIRDNLNGTFDLNDDIDLSGFPDWEPIGNRTHPFTGTLNGNNHTISGLKFKTVNDATDVGLFGDVVGGKIRDLKVEVVNNSPIYLTRDLSDYDNQHFGVLAGCAENGMTISRVTVSSNPTTPIKIIKTGRANLFVGGIVGVAYNNPTSIERSASHIVLDVENNFVVPSNDQGLFITTVGGIAGFNLNASSISNSYATGGITTYTKRFAYSGGITGFNWRGVITNSYALGTIYTNGDLGAYSGGIAGKNIGESYQGQIYNSAALNPSVRAYTNSTVANVFAATRISYNGSLGTNFALSTTIPEEKGYQRYPSSNANGNDGLDKALSELQSAYTWQSGYLNWDFNTIWYWGGTRPLLY